MINRYPNNPCRKIITLAAVESRGDQITQRQHFTPQALNRFDSVAEYAQDNLPLFSLQDLLEPRDGNTPRSVIVQGPPGIGKSTFAWELCQKWANGELYQEYDLLVLLPMSDRKVREATELKHLFSHLDKKLSEAVAEEVIRKNGVNVIFFFEGLDELPSNFLGEDCFLLELLRGVLPLLTTIVTSRPWAAQQLVDLCVNQEIRRVDIIGFLKEDIEKYICHSFEKNATEQQAFLEYFKIHPQLEMIMYVPLNAAFVVQIYKDRLQNQSTVDIPHTLTQLYTALVKRFIRSYMRNSPEFRGAKAVNLHKLPEPILSLFNVLCNVAFQSFTKVSVQLTFTDSDVENVDSLGLMHSVPDTSIDSDNSTLHKFLHFTVQEFLAAFYLSQQPPERQMWFFQTNQNDPKFAVLLSFLIGLNSSVVQHMGTYSSTLELAPHYLHWLFESQSPEDVAKFLGNNLVYFQTYTKLAPIDIYSLTYCLQHSNCTWNLIVDLEDLTTVYTSTNGSTEAFSGRIDELSIFNSTGSNVHKFFSLPPRLFKDMRFLYFFNREEINTEVEYYSMIHSLFRAGLFQNLVEFQLNDAPRHGGVGEVIAGLAECCPRLETLKIERCLIDLDDVIPFCECMTSASSSLARLALINMEFRKESLQYLFSALPLSTSLKRLDLSFNHLEQSDIEMLALAIESSRLQALRLRSCSIGPEGAEVLAKSLETNGCIAFLSLAQNALQFQGASALADMLKVNCTVQDIRVNGDDTIGRNGAGLLIDALKSNKTVEHLELSASCEPVEYGSAVMPKTNRVKLS